MLGKKKEEKILAKLVQDTKKVFHSIDISDKYLRNDEEFKLYQKYVVGKGLDEGLFETTFTGVLAVLNEELTVEDIQNM